MISKKRKPKMKYNKIKFNNAIQNQLVDMLLHNDLQKNLNKDTKEPKTTFVFKKCPLKPVF